MTQANMKANYMTAEEAVRLIKSYDKVYIQGSTSIPEVLRDGENAYLITPGDVNKLKERLLQLVENEELRIKFGQKSYMLIKRDFSLDSNIRRLNDIYKRLLAK